MRRKKDISEGTKEGWMKGAWERSNRKDEKGMRGRRESPSKCLLLLPGTETREPIMTIAVLPVSTTIPACLRYDQSHHSPLMWPHDSGTMQTS